VGWDLPVDGVPEARAFPLEINQYSYQMSGNCEDPEGNQLVQVRWSSFRRTGWRPWTWNHSLRVLR